MAHLANTLIAAREERQLKRILAALARYDLLMKRGYGDSSGQLRQLSTLPGSWQRPWIQYR